MDRKLIKQFGADILCFRIRTARQKKRMLYEDLDKRLLQLGKEERVLYQQQRNLGWTELIPPVQKGWKRYFVLREDVAQGQYANFFQNILNKINTYDWHHRKDFKVKRRKHGRKIYVVKEQKLLQPSPQYFKKLAFSEIEKQFFHVEHIYNKWSDKPDLEYIFREPWRFVLRIQPNMINKVRIKDPVLEARIRWISNYLEKNDYQKRLSKLLYGGDRWNERWFEEKYNERNPLKNKPVYRIMNELENERDIQ